jgi:hypothetical protein
MDFQRQTLNLSRQAHGEPGQPFQALRREDEEVLMT